MNLAALIDGLGLLPRNAAAGDHASSVRVCDLTEDSRTVVPGSLFIARKGLSSDGNSFIAAAVRAGAVAVVTDDLQSMGWGLSAVPIYATTDGALTAARLAERFYGNPSEKLAIALVTGTNGKTTTTYLIWKIFNAVGRRCGLIGTVIVDDGREVASASMTTPPSGEMSLALADMVDAGCVAAAIEASSHALDQKRLDAIRKHVGVFTNLTGDHLDYHKTMERYADAKARLFEMLPETGCAIVNAEDAASRRMLANCPAPVVNCAVLESQPKGPPGPGQARVEIIERAMTGMRLGLTGPWGSIEADVPLIGRYNAMNTLQAVCACHAMGLTHSELSRGLRSVSAPPGRLELVSKPDDNFAVYVDYAHSDDSLRSVLSAVRESMTARARNGAALSAAAGAPGSAPPQSRLVVVFGCGGDKDRTKRPRMGAVAAELADVVIITSDNPRTERPGSIIDEILAGVPKESRSSVTVQADRAAAISHAIANARRGDIIIIAGKGHETEQILPDGSGGTIRIHFDDREHARAALDARRARRQVAEPNAAASKGLQNRKKPPPGRFAGEEPQRHGY